MSTNKKYSGVVIPAITPLTGNYTIDETAVEKIFSNFYTAGAVPFILGTTGESASLPLALKKDFIATAEKYKKPGTILYAGIASNCLEESIELAGFCANHQVDVVVATAPSYYTLTRLQLHAYFLKLAENSSLPLIIYNIPATTQVSLPLSLIEELSVHPNIVGLKDSERDPERLDESINRWKDRVDFSHFTGWAAQSANALLKGSDGIIPSSGNLHPVNYTEMATAVLVGDSEKAMALQSLSDALGDLYQKGKTLGESLWALKYLMKIRNLCEPVVMPPLTAGTADEATTLQQLLLKMDLNEY
jgi:4-hydroxy-tetrahydrodipicolinate synthase